MILSDREILDLIDGGMISPAERALVRQTDGEGCISFGPSSYGYDVRLGSEFVLYKDTDEPLDPLCVRPDDYDRYVAEEVIIGPGDFLLGVTMETITMPPDTTAMLCDKSSLARSGISIQNTLMEAGWKGQITLEIHNQLRRPVILRSGQGIGQLIFFRGNPCMTTYADRNGKYQGQTGVVVPRA